MSTIIKQGAVIGLGVGFVVFAFYCLTKLAALQHSMTLNMLPCQLP